MPCLLWVRIICQKCTEVVNRHHHRCLTGSKYTSGTFIMLNDIDNYVLIFFIVIRCVWVWFHVYLSLKNLNKPRLFLTFDLLRPSSSFNQFSYFLFFFVFCFKTLESESTAVNLSQKYILINHWQHEVQSHMDSLHT